ncbi:MAG: flagellin [Desulfobulbaceae bacterium]|uniref:Flagellin n=1 Tax=Candidatus Desulfobia pelagia TaxID=2841692 RepID=A0A8J6ND52_9BACT|nr:flagellin [Candidatus Desulfobia pelagia]
MALTVNSNVASLNAQRNLVGSQNVLNRSLARLSSGLRINSAKDDAAGLAISDRMTSQIRGLNQAVRNANDGISLSQTAEGALQETTSILQRIRELSIQSANDTNTSADRAYIQAEVSQLQDEINRIATTTAFNGQRLLDGTFSTATFQVGSEAGETISFGIASAKGSAIGAIAEEAGTEVADAAATDITIAIGGGTAQAISSSADYAGTATGQEATSAYAKAAAINDAGIAALSAVATTSGTQTVGAVGGTAGDTYTLTINGTTVFAGVDAASGITNAAIRDQINLSSSSTGVIASLSGTDMTLTAADGRSILVAESGTGFAAGTDGLSVTGGDFADNLRGTITLSATSTIAFTGTTANIGFTGDISLDTSGVDDVDISTRAGADTAIKRVDAAIAVIDSIRGDLGAVQNRFESTIANLMNVAQNVTAARSRILDADFAAETADLTKAQILQQSGIAMLAQANTLPQAALTLLQG